LFFLNILTIVNIHTTAVATAKILLLKIEFTTFIVVATITNVVFFITFTDEESYDIILAEGYPPPLKSYLISLTAVIIAVMKLIRVIINCNFSFRANFLLALFFFFFTFSPPFYVLIIS